MSEAFGDDPKLEAVYYELAAGTAPREIAQKLKLSRDDVYNARKVIVRRLKPTANALIRELKE